MKRLSILRHAEAEPHDRARDFERALTAGGRAEARRMAARFAALAAPADFVLCSPARRTRETLEPFMDHVAENAACDFPPALYDSTDEAMFAAIHETPDTCAHILLVGHNPWLHALAVKLGRRDAGAARLVREFPPAALAIFDFDATGWDGVRAGRGALAHFSVPADAD